MSDAIEVKLKKEITAHGEQVSVLNFRELLAGDYAQHGFPILLGDGGMRVPNVPAIIGLIAAATSIPPSAVKQLGSSDFSECMGVVMGFFE